MSCSRLLNSASKTNHGSPDVISSAQKHNLDLFRSSAGTQAPCWRNRSMFQRQYSGADKITTGRQSGESLPSTLTTCRPCGARGGALVHTVAPEVPNVCVVAPEPGCNNGAGPSCGRVVSGARSCGTAQRKNPRQSTSTVVTNNACRNRCTKDSVAEGVCVREGSSNGTVAHGGHLIVGTCVLIAAIPDAYRPAGQSHAQKILAVVMYASNDGYYKLGTWKGAIGKMFSRDEMTISIKTGLSLKDVPDRTINMMEASSMSF